MVSFSMRRWSVVALPFFPPAWASEMLTFFRLRSFIIRSYTFPALLDTVIPLSLEHFPFFPLPLYIFVILPFLQVSGICFFSRIMLKILLYISFVLWFASIKTSFGILSGPVLLFRLSFLMVLSSSSGWISSCFVMSLFLVFVSLFFSIMAFVLGISSGVASLAW